jgi:hypothetical protein
LIFVWPPNQKARPTAPAMASAPTPRPRSSLLLLTLETTPLSPVVGTAGSCCILQAVCVCGDAGPRRIRSGDGLDRQRITARPNGSKIRGTLSRAPKFQGPNRRHPLSPLFAVASVFHLLQIRLRLTDSSCTSVHGGGKASIGENHNPQSCSSVKCRPSRLSARERRNRRME